LLSKGEFRGGEFRSVAKDATEKQHQDANHAHLTASESRDLGPETTTLTPNSSIRKSLADKADGIIEMDSGTPPACPPRRRGTALWSRRSATCSFRGPNHRWDRRNEHSGTIRTVNASLLAP